MPPKKDEDENPPKDYLRICCFMIGVLELLHSLTLAFNSIYELSLHQNIYNISAYLGAVAYVLTVKALVVGLWKSIPKLFIFWLLFATLATLTSIVLLIWNMVASPVYDKDHFIQWAIVYLGILYECTCLFLVFRYYRTFCPYSLLKGCNFGCLENERDETATEYEDDNVSKIEEYEQKSTRRSIEEKRKDEKRASFSLAEKRKDEKRASLY